MMVKRFILYIVFLYVLISIAVVLGGGYVIDWVPEVTLFQKMTYYAKEEFLNHFTTKLIVAALISVCAIAFVKKKKTDVR